MFSILLACALVLGMMPMAAFAGTETNSSTEVVEVSDAQDLKEAIESATDGTTITLKLKENIKDDFTISSGKNVILNLNDHTITNESSHTITVENGATLTITGNGTVDNVTHAKAAIWNEGTVTLSGGTYDRSHESGQDSGNNGGNSYYTIKNFGTMTVNDGVTVKQDGTQNGGTTGKYSSLFANGWQDGSTAGKPNKEPAVVGKGAILIINGGTFIGGLNTIKNDDYGTLEINGGTFENFAQSCFLNWNVATITDGTFDGTQASSAVILNGYINDTMDKGMLSISGGYFTGNTIIGKMQGLETDVAHVEISGGTFSSDVSDYLAEDYVQNSNGTVGTLDKVAVAEVVGGNKYATLADAIDAATEGATVMLLKDVTNQSTFNINGGKKISLNLNSYDLELLPSNYIRVENGALNLTGTGTVKSSYGGSYTPTISVIGSENNVTDFSVVTVGENVTVANEGSYGMAILYANDQKSSYGAKVTINGTLTSTYGFSVNGMVKQTSGNVPEIIVGETGKIVDSSAAIYAAGYAKYTINGTMEGDEFGIEIRAGELTVNETATIIASGDFSDPVPNGNGSTVTGAAIAVSQHTTNLPINVNINGGTISATGANGHALYEIDTVEKEGDNVSKDVTINVSGGNFSGGVYSTNNKLNISGGHFTSDPSEYLADDLVAVESEKVGYNYTVAAKNSESPAEVVIAAPEVAEPSLTNATEAEKDLANSVKKALSSDNSNLSISEGALTAAANAVANNNELDSDDKVVTDALKDAGVSTGNGVTIVIQPYIDIKITDVSIEDDNKTVTLDITPMYRTVATTAELDRNENIILGDDGTNAVQIGESQELTVTKPVTITIPLPSDFTENAPLYVNHIKNGRTYVYTGSVNSNVLTFTNPHGFSEFTITSASPVAELNGVGYASLTDAINDAKDGDEVTILKNNLTASMSGSSRTITLVNGTGSEITVTINGTQISIETDQNQDYPYTRPSSGGGGGTVETKYDISVDSAANGTVKASASTSAKDKTVTLTVTPDEGYVLDTLTVTDKDGKNVELTKKSDTEYTFQMPSSKVTVKAVFKEEAAESTLPFTDVSGADWFYPAVKYVYDNDMMDGVGGSLFAPASQLTRGMIAQVLYNLEKATGDFNGSFTDVAADEWYADAVNWAAECGIVNGFGDGTFGPEQNITREQMAQILMNYAKYKGYDMTAKGDVSAFTDAAEISGWAQDAVSWAVGEKILSGKGNGILDPAGTATRAEVAQIFMNFCENIAK